MKLVFVFALLSFAIVSAYDPTYCDPFPKNKVTSVYSNCKEYADVVYDSNEQGILINALFLPFGCPEMVINKTTDRPIGPTNPVVAWTFSYSIKWADATSKCVVGPSDIGLDQNGISNDPLEDISAFAVNQWYTRQFSIEAGRNLNFSISCASNTNTTTTRPFAIAKDFKWTIGIMEEFSYTASPCRSCRGISVWGAECRPTGVEDNYGRALRGWVYPRTYMQPILETTANLNVTGDVITNEIYVTGSIYATGCFFSYDRETGHSMENKIKLYLTPGNDLILVMNPSCAAPEYEVIPLPFYTFSGMQRNETCRNFTVDPYQIGSWNDNYFVEFTMSKTAITCLDDNNGKSSAVASYIIVAAVVPTVVCVVAIAVGAFFAIKKHKQLKLKNKHTNKKVPTTPKNDFLPAPMSVVTPNEEVSDAAVHH